jgi:hypothetical protein
MAKLHFNQKKSFTKAPLGNPRWAFWMLDVDNKIRIKIAVRLNA